MSALVDNSLASICTINQDSTRVGFNSSELQSGTNNDEEIKKSIDRMAISKLRSNLEGRCIGSGYVIPNITIVSGVAVTVGTGKTMIIDVLQLGGL